MILKQKTNEDYMKVLVGKQFFSINPICCGFMGYQVRLHINHKKGEIVECVFNGKCDSFYYQRWDYRTAIVFNFGPDYTFVQPEDVCQYILDNVDIYKYIDKYADDKTICRRIAERLNNNYLG